MKNPRNITILGAGITGLMAAYTLCRAGHNIALYDPAGFPADNANANASLLAGGMLAPYAEIEHMNGKWIKAGLRGIDIWRDIALDTGFTQNGSLLIAHPNDRYMLERFKIHLPPELQTYQNVKTLEPQASQQFQNGLFLNLEAHLDPRKTMRALCEFLQNEESITLIEDPTSNIQHPTSIVIDCRGMAADDPDLRGVKGETLRVRNPEFSLSRPVRIMHPRYPLYIIPREDHVFMVGATVIESADTKTSLRSAMELMSALYTLHPSFGDAEVLEIKAGIRPSYPDNLPRIIINENRISCNGLFRHGFLLAPVMAECVKDYLNDEENQFMPLFQRTKNEDHTQRAA